MSRTKQQTPLKSVDNYAVSVINLSSYVKPVVSEDSYSNDEWVKYGEDNNYFGYVNDRYYGSPTNNAIINGLAEMIYGGGLRVRDGSEADQIKIDELFDEESVQMICHDFKRQGNAAFEVIKMKSGNKFTINHLPIETIRANKANEKGEIDKFWFCNDWAMFEKGTNPTLKPISIPAFKGKDSAPKSIVFIRAYQPNTFYYSPPDYQGALPYAELEEEIANYHINNIKNAFTPSTVINYNNGVPDKATRDMIEEKTRDKFTGTNNAGRLLVAFNDNKENAVTMESFQLNDAHNQYDFLSGEARKQLMVGHRITSPMLFGIKDNTGLGNNAEELETASRLLDATVVRPKQNNILKAFNWVLDSFGIDVDIFFENLQPLSVTAENQEQTPTNEGNQITEVKASSHVDLDKYAESLVSLGENEDDILEKYELFDVGWAENEEVEDDIEGILNGMVKFDANSESSQDGNIFKVRYMYKTTSKNPPKDDNHRPLCSTLTKAALIYRKEDIIDLSSKGGAEAKGQSYNVFLYKGGVNCQHGWERRIFRKRLKKDGTAWGGGAMNGVTRAQIYDAIRGDAKVSQAADKKAYIAPRDTPSKGHK